MKIWLDDIRDPPDDTWTVVRNAPDCLVLLVKAKPGEIETLSLDHDLGNAETHSGYWLMCKVEWYLATYPNTFEPKLPAEFLIHSANPVGRKNMQAAIDSIERMRDG